MALHTVKIQRSQNHRKWNSGCQRLWEFEMFNAYRELAF